MWSERSILLFTYILLLKIQDYGSTGDIVLYIQYSDLLFLAIMISVLSQLATQNIATKQTIEISIDCSNDRSMKEG